MEGTTEESFIGGPEAVDYSKAFNEPLQRTRSWQQDCWLDPLPPMSIIDITNSQISTDRRTVLKMGAIYNELLRYTEL